ncbi:34855_t:CDS:1, partial [Racocetra persica]
HDPTPQIYQPNKINTLPSGNYAHEIPDKIIFWIQELQYYSKDIYKLFGNELADAENELNIIDFENFCESLCIEIENTLNGFVKWMNIWIHLPLSICRLGRE